MGLVSGPVAGSFTYNMTACIPIQRLIDQQIQHMRRFNIHHIPIGITDRNFRWMIQLRACTDKPGK